MSSDLKSQAQDAMHTGDFNAAHKFYATLLHQLHGQQDLDATLNYAFCSEKTGDYTEAAAAYQTVVDAINKTAIPLPKMQSTPQDEVTMAVGALTHALDDDEVVARLYLAGVHKKLTAGDVLCKYGDMPSHVWLLMKGCLLIQVDGTGETEQLHAISHGTCFVGEIGFYTGRRRSATVSALGEVELMELDTALLHRLEREEPAFALGLERLFRERLLERILSSHVVFSRMNEVARKQIAFSFRALYKDAGSVICHKGAEQDGLYLIKSGCLFLLNEEGGKLQLLESAIAGDIILLGGLLRGYKSRCRILAATPVALLFLPRRKFEDFKGSRPWLIQAILKHGRAHETEQVMHPDEDFLWSINRYVTVDDVTTLRPVRS
ncbi:MAG: cyclic nucleotide-binding domain-containing protein [Mariprofundaceae bacterium]